MPIENDRESGAKTRFLMTILASVIAGVLVAKIVDS